MNVHEDRAGDVECWRWQVNGVRVFVDGCVVVRREEMRLAEMRWNGMAICARWADAQGTHLNYGYDKIETTTEIECQESARARRKLVQSAGRTWRRNTQQSKSAPAIHSKVEQASMWSDWNNRRKSERWSKIQTLHINHARQIAWYAYRSEHLAALRRLNEIPGSRGKKTGIFLSKHTRTRLPVCRLRFLCVCVCALCGRAPEHPVWKLLSFII